MVNKMGEEFFKKENIFIQESFQDYESALTFLSEYLRSKGKVEDGFKKALLEREENYPTGLLVGDINVAIPHVDHQYVKESEVLLCTLEEPIPFRRMDLPEEEVDVSVIILLAIDSPDGHLGMLKQIIGFVQNQEVLKKMIKEKDKDSVSKILNEFFNS